MNNIIQMHNIKKIYPNKFQAVDNISISIEEGKIYGLLGPNGAGKSTLINILVGILKQTEGSIDIFDEKNISSHKKANSKIGYVPQEIAIYNKLTAIENVKFFASLYNLNDSDIKKNVERSLEFVGLQDHAKDYPSTFSGGMLRRLNIACAIAHNPKIIIFDEPTVGIDPQSRNHILESIKKLNQEGATIIYTSHYMEEVETLCDYIYIMDHGNIIEKGTKINILDKYGSILSSGYDIKIPDSHIDIAKKYYPDSLVDNIIHYNGTDIKVLIADLEEKNIIFDEIKHPNVNLEQVFLHLTGNKLRD